MPFYWAQRVPCTQVLLSECLLTGHGAEFCPRSMKAELAACPSKMRCPTGGHHKTAREKPRGRQLAVGRGWLREGQGQEVGSLTWSSSRPPMPSISPPARGPQEWHFLPPPLHSSSVPLLGELPVSHGVTLQKLPSRWSYCLQPTPLPCVLAGSQASQGKMPEDELGVPHPRRACFSTWFHRPLRCSGPNLVPILLCVPLALCVDGTSEPRWLCAPKYSRSASSCPLCLD